MKKYQLGEFEEVVILTIGVLYKNAYGVAIKNEIETRLSRSVSMGAMHTAIVRLEDKGYIKSFSGETTDDRMGRPKRCSTWRFSAAVGPSASSTATLPWASYWVICWERTVASASASRARA